MHTSSRYYKIAGIILALAGVVGTLTFTDTKYSLITLLGITFLLLGSRSESNRHQ
jgi:hypothetical protein